MFGNIRLAFGTIFENLRKSSESGRKSSENRQKRHHQFVYIIKRTLHVGSKIYMLFAGWEVRIVKNCDRGLETAARGRRSRAAFSSPRSQFFTIRTDPKPANNLVIFSADKLAYNWVYTTLLLSWFTCCIQTIVKNLTNERAGRLRHYTKKDVLKDRFRIALC